MSATAATDATGETENQETRAGSTPTSIPTDLGAIRKSLISALQLPILTTHSESRHGRLRGRSASPASGDEGDGRYGFAEDSTNVRTRYRSRSRSRNAGRSRREPSAERWTHDRANYGEKGGKWQKDMFYTDTSPMGNHRRSDAGSGGSLLSRMTKDGRPVNSLASRITRDDDDDPRPRSLASRITRNGDGEGYGRLKGDDSIPRDYEFDEPKPRRGLADRISRETEGINIRGQGANSGSGINIRGAAS